MSFVVQDAKPKKCVKCGNQFYLKGKGEYESNLCGWCLMEFGRKKGDDQNESNA